MKTAVYIDDLARAERKSIPRDGGGSAANVFRRPPALNRRQTVGDELVVFFLYRTGHVGGDDPGSNFVNIDAMLREARSRQRRQHLERSCTLAIIAAICRGGVSRDRRDGDNFRTNGFGLSVFYSFNHPPVFELGHEIGPFDIN